MTVELPGELVMRAPTMDDLAAVNALIRACEADEYGVPESTEDDLRGAWERARFDLARDAWLVVEGDGRVAGYADVWERQERSVLDGDGYVHPDRCGLGIGRLLVRLTESRARERLAGAPAGTRARLDNIVGGANGAARRLLEEEGYRPARYYWRMVIEMDSSPPASPEWPEGVGVRTFVRGQDEGAVHALVQEAFADNEGFVPYPLEEWSAFMIERESFDPTQWFLAMAGEEIIGAALCPRYEETGWVRQLAVRREWRRRGVGLALLRHAFGELHRRGQRTVGLVVDSYNRTSARALYERAGMRAAREHIGYRKELVVGR